MTILRRAEGEPRGGGPSNGVLPRTGPGTIIGRGTVMEGTLRTREPVRVSGSLRGRLEAEAPVIVDQGARLEGQVSVPEIVVAGLLDGEVECQGRCFVRASALVRGSIQLGALRIEEGAWLDGQFQMRPVDEPTQPARRRGAAPLPPATDEPAAKRPRAVGE